MKRFILFICIKIINCNNVFLLFDNSQIDIEKYISFGNKIGLIGFTPHPSSYIVQEGIIESFENILLGNIIDLKEFEDSIFKTIECAIKNNIKLLVSAYLPVYYKTLVEKCGQKKAIEIYHNFMRTYGEEIKDYFLNIVQRLKYDGNIVISIPPAILLSDLENIDAESRSYFLIKHFPTLLFADDKEYTLIIINGIASEEDDEIIHLFNEKHGLNYNIVYEKDYINKVKFHVYK